MQRLGDCEIKQIQLSILSVFARFCEENKIHYWLDYGTLLGAVRHKGYIPWDDDIDIGMLRSDYELFMRTFNANNERYQFFCPENTDGYIYSCGKVADMTTVLYEPDMHGSRFFLNIDVFVYDNAPDELTSKKMFQRVQRWLLLNMLQHNLIADRGKWYRKVIKGVASTLLKVFPYNYFVQKIVKNAKKYQNLESDKIGNFTWSDNILCDRSAVNTFTEVEFENMHFKAPGDYDYWLTQVFGNYMELPPEEERISHHQFEAYLKE